MWNTKENLLVIKMIRYFENPVERSMFTSGSLIYRSHVTFYDNFSDDFYVPSLEDSSFETKYEKTAVIICRDK